MVLFCWDIDKLEVEEENCGNPSIDGHVGLQVRIIQHPVDIKGIHLYYKVVNANQVETKCTECAEEAI
jgi:hypothetical protein